MVPEMRELFPWFVAYLHFGPDRDGNPAENPLVRVSMTMTMKTTIAAVAALTLVASVPALAENTVWISRSTPTLTVSETKTGYLISNGKARFVVAAGDKLPAVFQTEKGKVLRAGPAPKR